MFLLSPGHNAPGHDGMGIPMINADTARDLIATAKDEELEVTIVLTDNTEVTGDPISVNSKGVNLKIDGKTRSFGLARIVAVQVPDDMDMDEDDEADLIAAGELGDMETDEDIYAMLGDGMTTAELADHLSDALEVTMTPKELRVHLRALGLGVGKGRKYSLTATEYRMVKDLVTTAATA